MWQNVAFKGQIKRLDHFKVKPDKDSYPVKLYRNIAGGGLAGGLNYFVDVYSWRLMICVCLWRWWCRWFVVLCLLVGLRTHSNDISCLLVSISLYWCSVLSFALAFGVWHESVRQRCCWSRVYWLVWRVQKDVGGTCFFCLTFFFKKQYSQKQFIILLISWIILIIYLLFFHIW